MNSKNLFLSKFVESQINDIERDNSDDMTFFKGWFLSLENGLNALMLEVQNGIPSNSISLGNNKYAFSADIGYLIYTLINNSIYITEIEFLFLPNQRIGKIENFECELFWNKPMNNGLTCLAWDVHIGNVICFFLDGRTEPYQVSQSNTKFITIRGEIASIDSENKITLKSTTILLETLQSKQLHKINEYFWKLGVPSNVISLIEMKQKQSGLIS